MILSILLLATAAAAELQLPTFLSSHMVLQRAPQRAKLWGNATPGASISVSPLNGTATADKTGAWVLELPPQPASTGVTLHISDGSTTATLDDVAFGDVFVSGCHCCSSDCLIVRPHAFLGEDVHRTVE